MRITSRLALALAIVPGMFAVTACTSTTSALDECLSVVAHHFGVAENAVSVTETIESPIGAFDWKGTAGDGTFACASPDGDALTTALAFDSTGMPETLVLK